ncbi:hypothetical protein FJZ33_00675 [Candidatus Poribacteria bacterium]|nr:hypothetical protein [Candidatus Poribacteria bacterium]
MVKRGKPTVVFCNENFVSMAKLVAKSGGVPDLPLIIFPWSTDVLPEEDLRQLTDKAFKEVIASLTQAKSTA